MIDIKYSNFDFNNTSHDLAKSTTTQAVSKIINSIESKSPFYKIFSTTHAKSQAEFCLPYAQEINEKFSDLIVIGMGGAILNPQTVLSLVEKNSANSTNIHYLHNTDPLFLKELLSNIRLKDCAVLAISNSGQTLETLSLVGTMISEFDKAGLTSNIAKHFYFITNSESGILQNIASKIDGTIIEHTAKISGRYSGLTNVTSFIAQISGINIEEYISGAQSALDELYKHKEESKSSLAASCIFSIKKSIMVNVGYLQRFDSFLEWYSQIIAESLGKDQKGITPIRGLGPNDQHSMFQLYLDGNSDKIYSLFYVKSLDSKSSSYKTCNLKELDYIANKNLRDINTANYEATLHSLVKKGFPTRSILIESLSAKSIGYLIMHSMLEVVTLGHIMHINPFNQPEVENIKNESKKRIRTK